MIADVQKMNSVTQLYASAASKLRCIIHTHLNCNNYYGRAIGYIYNFISPSEHGSIAVKNKKELINTKTTVLERKLTNLNYIISAWHT